MTKERLPKMEVKVSGSHDETEISITASSLFDLVVDEVSEFFEDPRVFGVVLSKGEVRHIAGGIVQRAKISRQL